MKTLLSAFRLLCVLTALTGVIYPVAVWSVGRLAWHDAAEGSLLRRDGRLVGSSLLAQKTSDPRYFWPRPSAGDYATVASGASNLAWTSAKLAAAVAGRRVGSGTEAAPDMLTTSGSGLDPELSLLAIRSQLSRVAAARHLTANQQNKLDDLVAGQVKGGQITPARINVLKLNLALDAAFPPP